MTIRPPDRCISGLETQQSARRSQVFTWADSFSDFRAHCNEDQRIAEQFATDVVPRLASLSTLSWLDIGCGDCAKTATHARLIDEASSCLPAAATLLDPNFPDLLPAAASAAAAVIELIGDVRFLAMDLGAFVDQPRETRPFFNLITAIHSVHTLGGCDALISLLAEQARLSHTTIAFVVTESQGSEIYHIRRLIERVQINVPRPYTARIVEAARQVDAILDCRRINAQYCRINRDRLNTDDSYWFFPFLLGETCAAFRASGSSRQADVRKVVRKYIEETDREVLEVPDDAIMIELPPSRADRAVATDSAGG